MPTMKIEIELGSDALVQDAPNEIALMLAKVTRVLDDPAWSSMNLRDSNGNTVGHCWVEED